MDKGMGRLARASLPVSANIPVVRQEFSGVVREGKIELIEGNLPDGTQVQVRVKK
jgi:hypothetical protein